MNQFEGPLSFLFIGNSLLTLTLIFNQNESVKDAGGQNSRNLSNPLEGFTWICFFLQLFLLTIKTKAINF